MGVEIKTCGVRVPEKSKCKRAERGKITSQLFELFDSSISPWVLLVQMFFKAKRIADAGKSQAAEAKRIF